MDKIKQNFRMEKLYNFKSVLKESLAGTKVIADKLKPVFQAMQDVSLDEDAILYKNLDVRGLGEVVILGDSEKSESGMSYEFEIGHLSGIYNEEDYFLPESFAKDLGLTDEEYKINRRLSLLKDRTCIRITDGEGCFIKFKNSRYFMPLPVRQLGIHFRNLDYISEKSFLLTKILFALMKDCENMSYGMRDLWGEYENNPELLLANPYSFNDYLFSNNKVEFVRNKDKVLKESEIKKYPAAFSSYIRKARKYIMPRDVDKFISFLKGELKKGKDSIDYPIPSDFHTLLALFYMDYNNTHSFWVTEDTMDMMMKMKRPISLMWSPSKMRNIHEEISPQFRDYLLSTRTPENRKIFIPRKYRGLKVSGYKVLETVDEFVLEGKYQRNCVASYVSRVEDGRCVVLSGETNGTHYTVEVILDSDNYFKIYQMRSERNNPASQEDLDSFNLKLEKLNKRRKFKESEDAMDLITPETMYF